MNYVFYDFETSGKNKDFDQILQIGAVLTDEGFQVKDKIDISCRLKKDVIPAPEALLVNKISIDQLKSSEISHYSLVQQLKKQFEEAGLISLMSSATLEINTLQRENFVSRILKQFKTSNNKAIDLAVWGITFKPGTDDIRESQAVKIVNELLNNNFNINIYDPKGIKNAKKYYKNRKGIKFYIDKYKALENCDTLLLLTEWKEFRSPDFAQIKKTMNTPIIFDGRNIYNKEELDSVGIKYFQIGVK